MKTTEKYRQALEKEKCINAEDVKRRGKRRREIIQRTRY
jgi:hypothetical protein